MLRFLHCADFHIDSPLSALPPSKREEKRAELLGAFSAVIDIILQEEIPLCFIAGDLFDTESPSPGAVQAVRAGFERAGDCRFFITPGNHDPYTADSVWAKERFGDNVFVFDSPTLTAVSVPEHGATVYGYAFTASELPACPAVGARAEEGINILIAHADMRTGQSPDAPISEAQIGATGMDYAALGHIHNSGGIPRKIRDTVYAYSGCPVGRDFGECGKKGVLIGEIDAFDALKRTSAHFLPIAKHCYYRHDADISGCSDDGAVAEVIKAIIAESSLDENCSVRFTLTGNIPAEYHISRAAVKAMLPPLAECELTDKSVPLLDEEALRRDPSLRGEFYRALEKDLHSKDPAVKERAELALKLGMCAMDGGNIDEV